MAEFRNPPAPVEFSLAPTLTGTGSHVAPQVYTKYLVSCNSPNYTQFPNPGNDVHSRMQALYLRGYKDIHINLSPHATGFRIYKTISDPAESRNLDRPRPRRSPRTHERATP